MKYTTLLCAIIASVPFALMVSGVVAPHFLVAIVLALIVGKSLAHFQCSLQTVKAHHTLLAFGALLVCVPMMSALWSITPQSSLSASFSLLGLVACGLTGFVLAGTAPVQTVLIKSFALSMAVSAVLILPELLPTGGPIRALFAAAEYDFTRYLDKNVNRGLCALAVLVWPAMLGLHRIGRRRDMWILSLAVLLPIMCMHSLSAKMGWVFGMIVFLASWKWPRLFPKYFSVITALFFLCWPLVFSVLEKPVFLNPPVYDSLPASSQHRILIWRFVLDKVQEKPLLGWGMNTARVMPGAQELNRLNVPTMPLHAHNSVMQVILENGVVGLGLYVAALWLLLRQWAVFTSFQPIPGAAAGGAVMAYLAIGFTAFNPWQSWWLATGFLAAILWRLIASYKQEQGAYRNVEILQRESSS